MTCDLKYNIHMGAYVSANFTIWLRGLLAAFIGGGSSAVAGGVALNLDDGKDFNTQHPAHLLHIMASMFVISGAISMFTYLKQSPIPAPDPMKAAE